MKTVKLVTVILLCSFGFASAQDSLYKAKFGFETSYSRNKFNYQNIYAGLIFSKGKHQFVVGPGMYYLEPQQMTPFPSLQAGYRYFMNGTQNRFSLFFGYDFNYAQGKYTTTYRSYSFYQITQWDMVYRTLTYRAFDNFFSFGAKWRFFGRWYFTPQAGAGIGIYRERLAYRTDMASWESKGPFGFRYPFGLNTFAKFTLGCDIVRLKKKG